MEKRSKPWSKDLGTCSSHRSLIDLIRFDSIRSFRSVGLAWLAQQFLLPPATYCSSSSVRLSVCTQPSQTKPNQRRSLRECEREDLFLSSCVPAGRNNAAVISWKMSTDVSGPRSHAQWCGTPPATIRNTHTHSRSSPARKHASQPIRCKQICSWQTFSVQATHTRFHSRALPQPNPTQPHLYNHPPLLLLLLLLLPPHNANCTKAKNNSSTGSGAWIPRLLSTPTPNQPACKMVKSSGARNRNTSRFGTRFEAATQCTAQHSTGSRPFVEEWNARVFCESPKLEPRWWLAKSKGRRK